MVKNTFDTVKSALLFLSVLLAAGPFGFSAHAQTAADTLADLSRVPLAKFQEAATGKVPQVLFVDGANPPGPDAVWTIQEVLANKGKVAIWGVGTGKVDALNALLPLPELKEVFPL